MLLKQNEVGTPSFQRDAEAFTLHFQMEIRGVMQWQTLPNAHADPFKEVDQQIIDERSDILQELSMKSLLYILPASFESDVDLQKLVKRGVMFTLSYQVAIERLLIQRTRDYLLSYPDAFA